MIVKKIGKAIPVDANGKCHIAALVTAKLDNDDDDNEHQDEQQDKNKKPEPQMLCTDRCKLLTENDIKVIVEIRQYFDEPIKLLHQHLEDCDNDFFFYRHCSYFQSHPIHKVERNAGKDNYFYVVRQ